MKIAIFDDNKTDENILIEFLNIIMANYTVSYDLHIISKKADLLEEIKSIDLLFLDIELGDENGIEIGKDIRRTNKDCKIIITSNYQKYLIDGYKIKAERYLLKPLILNEFEAEMKDIINNYFQQSYGFVDESICPAKLYIKDIMYIEAINKRTSLYMTQNKIILTPYPLKYWMDKFKNALFSQSHKAYYINLNYVEDLIREHVILKNGKKVPLSRFYKKNFEFEYMNNLYSAQ